MSSNLIWPLLYSPPIHHARRCPMEQCAMLLEIGIEELPALPFLKELPNIESKWKLLLEEHNLQSEGTFYYTPRRMVFWHARFPGKQPDSNEEMFGPPEEIAFKDGAPAKAAESFAKKCGVSLDSLARAEKNGKTVLYFSRQKAGQSSESILPDLIKKLLEKLQFGKAMRWGSLQENFIRPIRWVNCLLDDTLIPLTLYGVNSSSITYAHRSVAHDPVEIHSSENYFDFLKGHGIVLSQSDRKDRILSQIADLEKSEGVKVEIDADLLDEIVSITEYPTALIGNFEEKFLALPPEVIITSMKEHQRYFAVYAGDKLTNKFLVVSNAYTDDFSKVISGNEKVLRARLSDALFFWHNDLKNGLSPEGLKNIVFAEGLGTLHDKVERELRIALTLFEQYKHPLMQETGLDEGELKALIERAVMLSKADLLTEMVYEFTELQGLMGYYYASALNESTFVSLALKEQYLPDGEESDLPGSLFSAIIALSHKMDNLLALFSAGMIPTGSKDPFALRRAALGLYKIIVDRNIPFDFSKYSDSLKDIYKSFDLSQLNAFVHERIHAFMETNPSVIKAVLGAGERDLLEVVKKTEALHTITQKETFKEWASTFKRVANITREIDLSADLSVNVSLFETAHEKALFAKYQTLKTDSERTETYEESLELLFSVKPELDRFFDHVMVNAEDEETRTNRKNLVACIYKLFLQIADLKEVTL